MLYRVHQMKFKLFVYVLQGTGAGIHVQSFLTHLLASLEPGLSHTDASQRNPGTSKSKAGASKRG